MSRRLRGMMGRRWNPLVLGESLPIARGMKISRWFGRSLLLASLLAAVWKAHALYNPELVDVASESTAIDALKRVDLPLWELGGRLRTGKPPQPMPTPRAPLWSWADPAVYGVDSETQAAIQAFEDGEPDEAEYLFRKLADSSGAWQPRYNQAISLAQLGLVDRALFVLEEAAEELTSARYSGLDRDPAYLSAWIVNHYALAEIRLQHEPDECLGPIRDLKRAVGRLETFVRSDGVRAAGRELPFRLSPTKLNSYDVWLRLNELYLQCEDYPAEYFGRRFGTERYRDQRVANPDLSLNSEGLFSQQANICWGNDGQTRDCWWRLNYNYLHWQSRTMTAALNPAFSANWPTLARLYQHLASILAKEDRSSDALSLLSTTSKLVQAAEPDLDAAEKQEWQESLEALALYIAVGGDDTTPERYAALGEPYQGRALADLELDGAEDWQLKGMSYALSQRWQEQVRGGEMDKMYEEIQAARGQIPARYFNSLKSWWEDEVQPEFRARLVRVIGEERSNSPERALAVRDFRSAYMGDGWPLRSSWVWLAPHWPALLFRLLIGMLFFGLWALVHRYVVYPYLLYNTNYYESEFRRRYKERQKEKLPFIAPELEEYRRKLRQATR